MTWEDTLRRGIKCPKCEDGRLSTGHEGGRYVVGSPKKKKGRGIMTCDRCGHKEKFV